MISRERGTIGWDGVPILRHGIFWANLRPELTTPVQLDEGKHVLGWDGGHLHQQALWPLIHGHIGWYLGLRLGLK